VHNVVCAAKAIFLRSLTAKGETAMTHELTSHVMWQTKLLVKFLGYEITAYCNPETDRDLPPTRRQMELLDSLENLPDAIKPELAEWARKDYHSRLQHWELSGEELAGEIGFPIDEENIERHFRIREAVVPGVNGCATAYLLLIGRCDWDAEHGIEFLLKDGSPIRCSAAEGLSTSAEWDEYLAR
jgi:hypothetical protein